MCQDLQKKLQLEVGFLNEYGCQIASWIKDWEAIASLIQDEHQASNCDEGEQTVLKQALKSKVLSILEKKIADDTGDSSIKSPQLCKDLEKELSLEQGFLREFHETVGIWILDWANGSNFKKKRPKQSPMHRRKQRN